MSHRISGVALLRYRCCLLSNDGLVASRREFVARDDSEATELARAIFRIYVESMRSQYGFELYRGARLVTRELLLPSLPEQPRVVNAGENSKIIPRRRGPKPTLQRLGDLAEGDNAA